MAQYGDQVAAVEPFGATYITPQERHGNPRQLFWLWFGANAETATWSVGILTIALYGTSFRGAVIGIVLGNIAAYGLLGLASLLGPRYGLPQMLQSRLAFGMCGNMFPAALSFLSGIGWFAVNCVLGAYALDLLIHIGYFASLAILCIAQIAIVIYGHNMIHAFERATAVLLSAGFAIFGVVTFSHADMHAAYNAHAPLAAGEATGIVLSAAVAFAYGIGWVPASADYSRYLPERSDPRAVWLWAFLGGLLPCTILEVMGAGAVSAVRGIDLSSVPPPAAVSALLGNGWAAKCGLLTIILGTATANCLNLYSGALAALVVWDPARRISSAAALGFVFTLGSVGLLLLARVSEPAHAPSVAGAIAIGLVVGGLVMLVARFTFKRWQAALLIGFIGTALATLGARPGDVQRLFTEFLLMLSAWASPWAGVVIAEWIALRRCAPNPLAAFSLHDPVKPGLFAWLAGLAASVPFLNQAWFVGPLVKAYPSMGDVSYYVAFSVAASVMLGLLRARKAAAARLPR